MWSWYIIKTDITSIDAYHVFKGPALVYFTDVVIIKSKNRDEALRMLEDRFLDDRAKRVNDDVYPGLSFALFKLKIVSRKDEVTHEKILNEIYSQISELADIRTVSGHSSDVMAKNFASVRGVKAFELVYRNPL